MNKERKTLANSKTPPYKDIDIEEVYKEIDSGKTISQVAKELGVCRQTLYNRHKEYQKQFEKKEEGFSIRKTLLESTDPRAKYLIRNHPEYLEED